MSKLRIFIGALLLLIGMIPVTAQAGADITSFSTSYTEIGRSALATRTARIPVSWATVNRPLTANLVFEQVLPDGSIINVELPRAIPWVNSSGNGVAAPILPDGEVSSIRLRVRLVSLFSDTVLDTEELVLAIVSGDAGGDGNGAAAAIVNFTPEYSTPINRTELNNGNVRLPVTWQAVNRPTWMNLIFEQVLPDGTVVNVELPRSNPWVNSADRGMIAPVAIGDAPQDIVLRVRLADFFRDRTYDQFYAYVPIQGAQASPEITQFSTTTQSITENAVAGGQYIDVSWAVSNRPQGTNLIFEQIFPDGTRRNAELPRDVAIVPSAGTGAVDPVIPSQSVTDLVFEIRLVDLANNSTLDSERIAVDLVVPDNENRRVIVEGDACYQAPFPESNGVTNGAEVRVQKFGGRTDAYVSDAAYNYNQVQTIAVGELAIVKDDPVCTYFEDREDETAIRRWYIESGNITGWIDEYLSSGGYDVQVIIPSNQADIPTAQIDSFTMSPTTIATSADIASTNFTFSWETTHAVKVNLTPVYGDSEAVDDTVVIGGNLIADADWVQGFTLIAIDEQNNRVSQTLTLSLDTGETTIRQFDASRTEGTPGDSVTYSWDISGAFTSARIDFDTDSQPEEIITITQAVGSASFTLPDSVWSGQRTATLVVETDGVTVEDSLPLTVTCQSDWVLTTGDNTCANPATTTNGAYQVFERGFMIWTGTDTLFTVLQNGTATGYSDTWDGQAYDIDGTPPEGLIEPERGFGYLWHTNPTVRSNFGWATAPEQSYSITSQFRYESDTVRYLNLPDGRVIRLVDIGGSNSSFTWAVVE